MPDITSFIVIFIFCALQYILSRFKWGVLGVIMPILYVVGMFYAYANGKINNLVVFIVLLIVGLIILIIEWKHGRNDRKNKYKTELNNMRKKDL